jgi:hypothetical protein
MGLAVKKVKHGSIDPPSAKCSPRPSSAVLVPRVINALCLAGQVSDIITTGINHCSKNAHFVNKIRSASKADQLLPSF